MRLLESAVKSSLYRTRRHQMTASFVHGSGVVPTLMQVQIMNSLGRLPPEFRLWRIELWQYYEDKFGCD